MARLVLDIDIGYRLLHCGALRAFFRPNLRRSFIRESRRSKRAFFKTGRRTTSSLIRARAKPCATAPACAVKPPPVTLISACAVAGGSSASNGARAGCCNSFVEKYCSRVLLLQIGRAHVLTP